ncbi:hypothetical protein H6F89_32705 [Cyanobacteria bacterium FACHB-63]|nr:hypothetical protein [Cyanobacteria bacterium FACHB-63]
MGGNSGSNGSSSGTSGGSSSNRNDADQQNRRPDEPPSNQSGNGITKEGPSYKVDGNEDSDTSENGWYADADANAGQASAGAGWRTDEFDSFQAGVEARAGATGDQEGELGADAEVKAEFGNNVFGVSASAGGGVGGDLSGLSNGGKIGGGASIGADVQGRVGNAQKNGNEFAVSVGPGAGGAGALIVGDDIDGDGQKEYGLQFGAKWGIGGAVSLRVEPEAVADRFNEAVDYLFGSDGEKIVHKGKKEAPKADVDSCVGRLESALEMPRIKEASARLESLLPI